MIILLSKSDLKDNYASWLQKLNPEIQLQNAYSENHEFIDTIIQQCSGIVLTGGSDINPARYGRISEKDRCEGVDDSRDELEMKLVATALENKIPLLAICRGVQLVNVFFNGMLVVDIPTDYGKKVEHRNKEDVSHRITIAKESDLFKYGQARQHIVNSSHHQAVKTPGNGLIAVAWSNDGLIEAVELDHHYAHPFFIGIQWHPERMDISHPLSGQIGKAFLQQAEEYDDRKIT